MERETERIRDGLFAACEILKSTSLSYPNRASILGFLGAAIVANAAGANALPYHLDAELRAHIRDALKPLGFTVKRAPGRRAPKYSKNSIDSRPFRTPLARFHRVRQHLAAIYSPRGPRGFMPVLAAQSMTVPDKGQMPMSTAIRAHTPALPSSLVIMQQE